MPGSEVVHQAQLSKLHLRRCFPKLSLCRKNLQGESLIPSSSFTPHPSTYDDNRRSILMSCVLWEQNASYFNQNWHLNVSPRTIHLQLLVHCVNCLVLQFPFLSQSIGSLGTSPVLVGFGCAIQGKTNKFITLLQRENTLEFFLQQ